ncbi:MAG: AAA family ATPase [Planctomycetota bacterium]|nr:MAG: AAA family ATPase [Planctomycetota bacterium]
MPIPISEMPTQISMEEAVEVVYAEDIQWILRKLKFGLSTLIECDKQLAPYLFLAIRKGLGNSLPCHLITGYHSEEGGLLGGILQELAQIVKMNKTDGIMVLLHLDLLTTTTRTSLNPETREAIGWFYENPNLVLLGFKDPNFEIPKVVENVFAVKRTILGIPREKLGQIILQKEARKFCKEVFHPHRLYKYVSGLNAIRFRQVISHFSNYMDYDPRNEEELERIYHEIRELTLLSSMEIPQVDLHKDVGGYDHVKQQLEENILSLLRRKDTLKESEEIRSIEELIPRGIIFYGPPGTGKTYFAKALATSIEAALIVVSGPELKSKWVGESEENLRRIFAQARQSAPSIIVFDEIDSFAAQRGMYGSSGVEHSMVNQLLTEMDGFRKEELVFVIGTTNFPEALDPALLRPGRFEFYLEIPYPNDEDRFKILEIYNQRFQIGLSQKDLEYLVRRTRGYVDIEKGIRYSGDHLAALCREIKRRILRKGGKKATIEDLDSSFGKQYIGKSPSKKEEKRVAIHEAGHVVLSMVLPYGKGVEQVTIDTGIEFLAGTTREKKRLHLGRETREELVSDIVIALGGRAAEEIVFGNISVGAWDDLQRATSIAKMMVQDFGMDPEIGPRSLTLEKEGLMSEELRQKRDQAIEKILKDAYLQARQTLEAHRKVLEELGRKLLEKRILKSHELQKFFPKGKTFHPKNRTADLENKEKI